ncbi:hypothetical protein IFM89_003038 [Coptis chinensis]|uniref:Uncharacterized protein n=1 Tax=Coptis chinensis TaxID=261450 RepID=A0A835MDV0_9MAGN|nr:hypothetical protein IFM89_003038 [Coptis chinensis]
MDICMIIVFIVMLFPMKSVARDNSSDSETIVSLPCSRRYLSESYFEKHDSLTDLDFQGHLAHELPLCGCNQFQHNLNYVPRLSDPQRDLVGEVIERLPSGVFADPFELQHLVQRGVFTDAAVFGDTNLELPSALSNRSVVEIHVEIGQNFLSVNAKELEVKVDIPLHARYPPLDSNGYSRVEMGMPDVLMRCSFKEKSEYNDCVWTTLPERTDSNTNNSGSCSSPSHHHHDHAHHRDDVDVADHSKCSHGIIIMNNLISIAGAMLGDAFLHQLPHAFESLDGKDENELEIPSKEDVLDGVSVGSLTDQNNSKNESLRKRVTTKGATDEDKPDTDAVESTPASETKPDSSSSNLVFGYLNLFSAGVHNFTDGMALGSAFLLHGSVGGGLKHYFFLHTKFHKRLNFKEGNIAWRIIPLGRFTTAMAYGCHRYGHTVGDFGILVKVRFHRLQSPLFQFFISVGGISRSCIGSAIRTGSRTIIPD